MEKSRDCHNHKTQPKTRHQEEEKKDNNTYKKNRLQLNMNKNNTGTTALERPVPGR